MHIKRGKFVRIFKLFIRNSGFKVQPFFFILFDKSNFPHTVVKLKKKMSELQINTTQNVKINFTAAGVGERLLAYIIDSLVKIGYITILNLSVGAFEDMD